MKNKVVEFDVIKSISDGIALQPYQFLLIRKLPVQYKTVEREEEDPTNPDNKGLNTADPKYKFKKTKVKEEAMMQLGVVVKVDDTSLYLQANPKDGMAAPPYKIGDTVVYHSRSGMPIDIIKGDYILVRPFEVIGRWDNSKDNK
jgi:hypothetical protein